MRVLVTRPETDGERTAAHLRARGCDVMLAPLLRIEPVDAEVGDGPWGGLVLTSGNAVRAVASHRQKARLLSLTVFTVGARTAGGLGRGHCQASRLVLRPGGNVQEPLVVPKPLGVLEVDPVLLQVRSAFRRIVVNPWANMD